MILSDLAVTVAGLCRDHLRSPDLIGEDETTGVLTFTFDPPLTSAEQAIFAGLVREAKSHIPGVSPDEWTALEPDLAGLRSYMGVASPTNAQTAAATKAIIRVLRAMFRDT